MNGLFAPRGGNLNKPIFKSPNARGVARGGLLNFRIDRRIMPGSSKDETREETSKRLRNVKSILAKFGSDPTYKVKSKGSKYYGYNVEELEAEAFKLETIKAHQEHAEKLLKGKQPLSTQLQEKKAKLKPPKKQEKKEISKTPLEKAF